MSDNDSGIRWGALAKTILAGAAIAAGVMLVTPAGAAMIASLGAGGAAAAGTGAAATGAAAAAGGAAGAAGAAGATAAGTGTLAAGATALSQFMSSGIGWLVTKLVGAAVIYKGAQALGNSDNEGPDLNARRQEAETSFAAREDMRKMQAVMIARMKANGHQPAMAVANDRGR